MNYRMKDVATVFVDIDDTLWWFTENSKLALRHVYDAFALEQMCAYERFKEVYVAKNKELWDLFHHGHIAKDFLVTERFRFTLATCGYAGDVEAMSARINEEYLRHLATLPTTLPGARDLLEYLVARGYDVNTLSNGFKGTQQQKLASAGIGHLIHRHVLSDDCGITKPQRGIFDYALEQCGAEAATSVMIGDNPDADIRGAHEAGWRTIYFNLRGVDAVEGTADAVVTNLEEIKQIL
ncbi:MAG: YjjG family noncanonical pyrimidine nucleotidase [Bacteroidales bacterium]|nr:YjjG family noncanonical pyrimidine nucleotidase [Bacteroidales bacterium]